MSRINLLKYIFYFIFTSCIVADKLKGFAVSKLFELYFLQLFFAALGVYENGYPLIDAFSFLLQYKK